jgi:hypothetical protein
MSYQVSSLNLYQERKKVVNQIMTRLQSEQVEGGLLSDLSTIVYGDRTDTANVTEEATVWIIPQPHEIQIINGHATIHDFTFEFTSMLIDYDSNTGKDRVEDVSARVYDALLKNRSTNDVIFDTRPLVYNPASEAFENSNIYFASVQIAFRIQKRE